MLLHNLAVPPVIFLNLLFNHRWNYFHPPCCTKYIKMVIIVLRRANELQAQGQRVLHCEVGQPETGAPTAVAHAAVAALTNVNPRMVMGYTDSFGLFELRAKIAQHYAKYYNNSNETTEIVIPTSRIVVTTGSSGAFLLAFTACFDAGDVVAIASSGYPCYRNILQALGCEICNVSINQDFKLTANELRIEIARRIKQDLQPLKGLILSSPSNPTGAMLTPNELRDLCHLADEYNIQFLSDEIYHGISYGIEEATALQFSPNVVVINSFSKYYSSTYTKCLPCSILRRA
jgi:aspartate/methionine/tyrosine aminotransferase